jgi:hypothetical protein
MAEQLPQNKLVASAPPQLVQLGSKFGPLSRELAT